MKVEVRLLSEYRFTAVFISNRIPESLREWVMGNHKYVESAVWDYRISEQSWTYSVTFTGSERLTELLLRYS